MKFSLKQKLGALLFDVPRYILLFAKSALTNFPAWLYIKNRNQALISHSEQIGVQCDWQWTSDLFLPKLFPRFGKALFQHALNSYEIRLSQAPVSDQTQMPEVSFIIGHRGTERLQLLLKTLESVAAQSGCLVECIVVEQDHKPLIKDLLPSWVRYVFTPLAESKTAYSRSWAFNEGAEVAKSNCLIFHDNDLLVPTCYAAQTLKYCEQGFDFINLKRFIFYLTQESTRALGSGADINSKLEIESIMQNALGGGSIGAARDAFNKIGKFDQRFVGWGGEDTEFWERACTLNIWSHTYLPLIHQWHASQAEKPDQQSLDKTHLYWELQKESPSERIAKLTSLPPSTSINAEGNYDAR